MKPATATPQPTLTPIIGTKRSTWNKIKIALIFTILVVLIVVEFFLGFIVAVCNHLSDATTAIQRLYDAAIAKAKS